MLKQKTPQEKKRETVWREVAVTDLPSLNEPLGKHPTKRLAHYFKRLLKRYRHEEDDCIHLPSVLDLSRFFHCTEAQVLEGLKEFKHRGFHYETHGLDIPILCRQGVGYREHDVLSKPKCPEDFYAPYTWEPFDGKTRTVQGKPLRSTQRAVCSFGRNPAQTMGVRWAHVDFPLSFPPNGTSFHWGEGLAPED